MEITELEHNKTYKYLRINDANGKNHILNKEKIRKFHENKSHIKNRIECKK